MNPKSTLTLSTLGLDPIALSKVGAGLAPVFAREGG